MRPAGGFLLIQLSNARVQLLIAWLMAFLVFQAGSAVF